MTLDYDVKLEIGHSDIEYRVTITNRAFIKRALPGTYIRTIATLLEVTDMEKISIKPLNILLLPFSY